MTCPLLALSDSLCNSQRWGSMPDQAALVAAQLLHELRQEEGHL